VVRKPLRFRQPTWNSSPPLVWPTDEKSPADEEIGGTLQPRERDLVVVDFRDSSV
jgi:hypothetical protein